MRTIAGLTAFVLCAGLAGVSSAGAQSDSAHIPGDAALQRARQLVSAGKNAEARTLIDSVLATSTPQDPIYGEALYTRAALAPNAAEAERDYRRLLIETPLAPRAEDAMLQLANLLQVMEEAIGPVRVAIAAERASTCSGSCSTSRTVRRGRARRSRSCVSSSSRVRSRKRAHAKR